jgi:hypothetical protein
MAAVSSAGFDPSANGFIDRLTETSTSSMIRASFFFGYFLTSVLGASTEVTGGSSGAS